MDVRSYLAVARRWWWTILAAALAAGLSGYFAASAVPPTYETGTRLLVGPVHADFDTIRASGLLVETYVQLALNEAALQQVRDNLGLQASTVELREEVDATADPNTRLLTIDARHGDPVAAARIADEIASILMTRVGNATTNPAGRLTVIDPASVPNEPVAPNVPTLTVMSLGTGLLAALFLILIIERFGDTISTRHELADLRGIPFLGTVRLRSHRRQPGQPVIESLLESNTSGTAQLLATKLAFSGDGSARRVLSILSTAAGDSTGELAAHIATVLSRSGRSVALIDAHESNSRVSHIFGAGSVPGLGEVLAWPSPIAESPVIENSFIDQGNGLQLMARGSLTNRLIDQEQAELLMSELLKKFDFVVAVTAPVHLSANALIWARLSNAVMLVVQRDVTKREHLAYAHEALAPLAPDSIGVALLERKWSLFGQRGSNRGRPVSRPRSHTTSAPARMLGASRTRRPRP